MATVAQPVSPRRRRAAAPSLPAAALALMALAAFLPFALVSLPSMTDLAGHIGRYHVMMDGGHSPGLARYYAFEWRLVGNLGGDLVVRALAPWLGVERAAWVMAASLAPLTLAGIAAVSRAAHERVTPGAALAGLFVLSNPLMFGFVNYVLGFAVALFAFAAWIALRERGPLSHLAALTPLVFATWLAHAMAWGALGLMVGGFELVRLWERRDRAALIDGGVRLLAFVPPVLLTVLWRSGSEGVLFAYGTAVWKRKIMNWIVVLRGEAKAIDILTPALAGVAVLATLWTRAQRVDPRIFAGGALLALATFVMPMTLMGSWGADERLVPAAVILLCLSLRWTGSAGGAARVVLLALALFGVRTALIARDWRAADGKYQAALGALDRVPRGARIHALAFATCRPAWRSQAWFHLPSLAIARREALVNTQWYLPGAAMLRVKYPVDPAWGYDPSQQVRTTDCAGRVSLAPLHARLARLDETRWDYVWVLGTGGARDLWPGHAPIYATPDSALFMLR